MKCLSSAYLHSLTVCAVNVPCAPRAKERTTDNQKAYNCSYICNLNVTFLAVLVMHTIQQQQQQASFITKLKRKKVKHYNIIY